MKTILELSYTEAKQYFLNKESYCNIDLPNYFNFQTLIDTVSVKIGEKEFVSAICKNEKRCCKNKSYLPKEFEKVNYTLLNNKDGKYAWRPLQLINPVLYVYLVREITKEDNWNFIVNRFKQFYKNDKIKCCSIPLADNNQIKPPKKKTTILNWWENIEQSSLELALEYDCLLNTDITDCYGSIYTHTIPWALHNKEAAKLDHSDRLIGNLIDVIIQGMSYGQTNGIPQGSVLMDFIAEIILGYADLQLTERLEEDGITDYKILRYRDDYRVFSNSQETITKIVKFLTEVLIGLNFRLNSQKTFLSNNIIVDAIKPDKVYWLGKNDFVQKNKIDKNNDNNEEVDKENADSNINFQKTLLLIHSLSMKFPNSGSLATALSDFQKRLYYDHKIGKENIKAIISIIVDIAYKNPRVYSMATAILSKLLSLLNDNDKVCLIMRGIEDKFQKIPNVGYLQIWLQRLTLKINGDKDYKELLCQKVKDSNILLWNNDWLNCEIKREIDSISIIDNDYIEKMEVIISPDEVQYFEIIS